MSKEWKPSNEKDKNEINIVARRHFKALQEKEKAQYQEVLKLFDKYQNITTNSMSPNKIGYVDCDDSVKEFEHIGANDKGENIYNVIEAKIDRTEGRLSFFHSFIVEHELDLNSVNSIFIKSNKNRVSPFGGAYKTILCSNKSRGKKYRHMYYNNDEKYRIDYHNIIDNENFDIFYVKRDNYMTEKCGFIVCVRGNYNVSFNSIEDFRAICELYKDKDFARIPGECMIHLQEKEREFK